MDKLSDLNEKSEYKKIMYDYNNNYGFNTGLNSFKKTKISNNQEFKVKGNINAKKR